jgi:dynein heavy chain
VSIADQLHKLYLTFQPYIPLILALKNPDLMPRHWSELNKLLGTQVLDPELQISIAKLVSDFKIMDHIDQINKISTTATAQHQLQ